MSSNTDFFAQMAAELDKTALDHDHVIPASDISPQQKMNVLNLDLKLYSGSVLADSIAQICQGVIGRLISEHGGVDKLLTSRMGLDNHRAELTKDFYEHKKFLKAEIMMELSDVIAEQIEDRLRPFSVADDLRERVRRFSLNGSSSDSDVAEDGE